MMARMKARIKKIADLSVDISLYSLNRLSLKYELLTK